MKKKRFRYLVRNEKTGLYWTGSSFSGSKSTGKPVSLEKLGDLLFNYEDCLYEVVELTTH